LLSVFLCISHFIVARQWLGKRSRGNEYTCNNKGKVGGSVFYVVSSTQCIVKRQHESRVEVGSNTSTVAMRIVGGNEKRNLEFERVKYGDESLETRT
jgi:hypothetical protein